VVHKTPIHDHIVFSGHTSVVHVAMRTFYEGARVSC
jgi:hypothetical protein